MREGEKGGPLEMVVGAAFIGLIIYLLVRKKNQATVSSQLPVQQPPHVIEKIIERQVVVERCSRRSARLVRASTAAHLAEGSTQDDAAKGTASSLSLR
jgi:LPXTG-motif cell wall-anchored protein